MGLDVRRGCRTRRFFSSEPLSDVINCWILHLGKKGTWLGLLLRGQEQRKICSLWSVFRYMSKLHSMLFWGSMWLKNWAFTCYRTPGPAMEPLGAQSYQGTYSHPLSANFSADNLQEPVWLTFRKFETLLQDWDHSSSHHCTHEDWAGGVGEFLVHSSILCAFLGEEKNVKKY